MLYKTSATSPVAKIRIPTRTISDISLGENTLFCFGIFILFLKVETIHPQFIAIWSPVKSTTKFKGKLCAARHDRSLIVFIPSFGRTTSEIIKPDTNSIITSMNKIELRKKLNLVRLLVILKNFFVAA